MNIFIVFFAGILSFLSPCILPIIPLYITYLTGNARETLEDGKIIYKRKQTFLYTLYFIIGICTTFFLLGISFTALGKFLRNYQDIFIKIGAIIIIIMGLFQIGIFKLNFLNKERKIQFNIFNKKLNPFIAFIMGFTFSFSWTPCVGPTLSSILILASSSKDFIYGNFLVFIYSLGFIIPFFILGIFTTQALNFFKNNQKIVKYTVKISGALLILIGIFMFTGQIKGLAKYFNGIGNNYKNEKVQENEKIQENKNEEDTLNNNANNENENKNKNKNENKKTVLAPDFELKDQYGNLHKFSDYKGKIVILNFWATWCPNCDVEMPEFEEVYKEYGLNKEDLAIIGIANPDGIDSKKEDIIAFLKERNITFPTVLDETGELFLTYGVTSLPTTFAITPSGEVYGYVLGSLNKEALIDIINQVKGNIKKESN